MAEIQALQSDDLVLVPAWLLVSFLTLDMLFNSFKLCCVDDKGTIIATLLEAPDKYLIVFKYCCYYFTKDMET